MKSFWTEGTIDAALNLCINAGGFATTPDSLFACFRYWPTQYKAVEEMEWYALERMNLRTGPLLHVVAMIEPGNGYRIFSGMIRTMNVYGVSAHRWDRRNKEWRFTVRRNVRFVNPEGGNGQLRRQQEQE